MDERKRVTLESYERHASGFADKFSRLFDVGERREFHKFLEYLNGKRILDVGCGSGDHAAWFKSQGLDVVCIDISPSMVEIAREKGVDARVMDMESLDFPSGIFDGVWADASLLHLPKSRFPLAVERIARVLKEGGILFVALKQGEGEGFAGNEDERRFFSFWKVDELDKALLPWFSKLEGWTSAVGSAVFICRFYRRDSIL